MSGPSWLRWALAAAFLAVAGYCVVRLVAAHRAPASYRGCHRALDVAHLVMGLGMAVMCSPIGGPVPAAGWETAFVLIAAWFLGTSWHRWRTGAVAEPIGWHGGALHHAAAALAMIYMLAGMPDAHHRSVAWMAGMPPHGGFLGWLIAGYFAGYAVLLLMSGACGANHRTLLWRRGTRRQSFRARPLPASDVPIPPILLAPRITAGCQLIMTLGTGYLVVPVG